MARSEFNPQWGRCSVRAFSLLLLPSPSSSHHRHHHHHPIIAIIIIIPSLITIIITSPSSQHHCNPCHHYHHSHHHHHPQTTTMSTLGECCVHEIMWYVTFGEWLFSPLSIMPLRFIEVAVYINSFFFFFFLQLVVFHCMDIRASLILQLIKNPPAMQETPVCFLGREDLLEKG